MQNSGLNYSERLEVLGLESLEERRIKSDIILFKKVIDGTVPCLDFDFQILENNRRSNGNFTHEFCRTHTREGFWAIRCIKIWNVLFKNEDRSLCTKKFIEKIKHFDVRHICKGRWDS